MDEDLSSSEQDEMQEDSGNDQDHMVIPTESKPDLHQVNSALAPATIGRQRGVKDEDMITTLLPSLHTSSYLTRSLEAQHNQGIPDIKPAQSNPVPATAIAGLNQPIYNFASWDQGNAYAGNNQQNNPTLLANSNNPNLLGYSSSANSSESSSGSTYNSSHSHLGSGGSASLASPYSHTGSNQTQGTPGSALGLDLGLPPSPAMPVRPTPQEVRHFQGFNFPGDNNKNATSAGDQQHFRLPSYSTGQQQQQQQQQQQSYETFPSFQGPNLSHHHQRANSTASAAAAGGNYFNGPTSGSQGYTNQSSSPTATQSFLASGTSGPYSPHISQRDSSTSINSTTRPRPIQTSSAASYTPSSSAPAASDFSSQNGFERGYRKKAPSFVPSFWAHMSIQHQEPPASSTAPLPLSHQQYQQSLYTHMQHHRSMTSSSFSPTDDGFELLSNHSDTSSPISAPSLLSTTSPMLTTSMNLYSLTSPASENSNLPSLSSSFSSTFSGDFFNGASDVGGLTSNTNGVNDGGDASGAFKLRSSFMEPLLTLDATNRAMGSAPMDLNAAMLKAADAHTDQVSTSFCWIKALIELIVSSPCAICRVLSSSTGQRETHHPSLSQVYHQKMPSLHQV